MDYGVWCALRSWLVRACACELGLELELEPPIPAARNQKPNGQTLSGGYAYLTRNKSFISACWARNPSPALKYRSALHVYKRQAKQKQIQLLKKTS